MSLHKDQVAHEEINPVSYVVTRALIIALGGYLKGRGMAASQHEFREAEHMIANYLGREIGQLDQEILRAREKEKLLCAQAQADVYFPAEAATSEDGDELFEASRDDAKRQVGKTASHSSRRV